VAEREQFALSDESIRRLLRIFRKEKIFEEALVLSTCNRTEVYFIWKGEGDPLDYLLDHIARIKSISSPIDKSVFYRYDGESAVTHLFGVAAALDSQIVGEHQILGQIKRAYRTALEERTARFLLNRLLHWSFRVGRSVQSDTRLGRGSVSIAQVAVDLASQIFDSLADKTVMLIGAGRNAELAARVLMRCNVSRVIVANRTLSRAREVAAALLSPRVGDKFKAVIDDRQTEDNQTQIRCTTEAIKLSAIVDAICDVDLIICSAASPDPLLKYEQIGGVVGDSDRSLFIVDIAVPRNVDPRIGSLPTVHLYNLDDLDELVAQNIERRRAEIPKAEAIVATEVKRFTKWLDSLQVAPTIKLLKRRFGELRKAEIERYGRKFAGKDRQQLERFTESLCRKILHDPITYLRQLSEDSTNSDCLAGVDMIRRIFSLDDVEKE
jgi:glutamyl-tRNA reductase